MPNGDDVRLGTEYVSVRLREYESVPGPGPGDEGEAPRGPSALHDLVAAFPHLRGRIRLQVTSVDRETIQELWARARKLDPAYDEPPPGHWYAVAYDREAEAREIVAFLERHEGVVSVSIVKAGPEPDEGPEDNPLAGDQTHLKDAEEGIGAWRAWGNAGADGSGVAFVDIERGWTTDHEDLVAHDIPAPLTGTIRDKSRAHGTQVLGVVCAVDNGLYGIGIAPKPKAVYVASRHETTVADALAKASETLGPGDVILLEVQDEDADTGMMIPVELDEATYEYVRLATGLQISVIEVAGNGNNWNVGTNLDDYAVLDRSSDQFRDSRAVMVAAALRLAKGGGGEEWYRRDESNYGSRIDCFAQGEGVVSCSSNDAGATTASSKSLGMTSGAAAIVAGAAVALQGMARQTLGTHLTPEALRAYLADPQTGTLPSLDEPTWIGVMPDLDALKGLLDARVEPPPALPIAIAFAWRVSNLCGTARSFTVCVREDEGSADVEYLLQDRLLDPGGFQSGPPWTPQHTPKRHVEATAGNARCCVKADAQFARIEVRLEATGELTIELRDAAWQIVAEATGAADCPA